MKRSAGNDEEKEGSHTHLTLICTVCSLQCTQSLLHLLRMQLHLCLVRFHLELTELHGNQLAFQHLHAICQVRKLLLCSASNLLQYRHNLLGTLKHGFFYTNSMYSEGCHALWRSLNFRAPRLFLSIAAAVRCPFGFGAGPALPSALPLLALELDFASLFSPCSLTTRHCLGVQIGAQMQELPFKECKGQWCLNARIKTFFAQIILATGNKSKCGSLVSTNPLKAKMLS